MFDDEDYGHDKIRKAIQRLNEDILAAAQRDPEILERGRRGQVSLYGTHTIDGVPHFDLHRQQRGW